jgi:tetratricopeptide (TPR) repeat protein
VALWRGSRSSERSEIDFRIESLAKETPPEAADGLREIEEQLRELARVTGVTPELLNAAAQTLVSFNRVEDAAALWRECLAQDPNYPPALCGLGQYHADRGEHVEASRFFRQANEVEPHSPAHAARIAQELLAQDQADAVISLLKPLVEDWPSEVAILTLLGQAYVRKKSFRPAVRILERTIVLAPELTNAYFSLGQAAAALGERELAQEYLRAFQLLKKRDEESHRRLLREKDDRRDTLRLLAESFARVAALFLGSGNPQAAEALLQRALHIDPESGPALELLAWLYHRQGRLDECRQVLQRLERLSNYLPGQLVCGSLYGDMKMFPQAESALLHAIQLAPQQSATYAALATLYLRWGIKLNEARQAALYAVDLDPSGENFELLATTCTACGDTAGATSARQFARLTGSLPPAQAPRFPVP